MHGYCSLVLPVRDEAGSPAALKVSYDGDDETEHEAVALQHWQGEGAVRLLRADPRRRAMLLERLHARDLSELGVVEACEVVAGLYPRLHRPALPQLRPLTSYVARWLDQVEELDGGLPVPPRMVDQALQLGRDLVADPASTRVVVHGDLHYANVLAADREPWLAIDPAPMNGDPHYEVAPLLWNRWEEMAHDVRGSIRHRFHTVVDAAGLEEDRARDWAIVRMVVDASWTLRDARRGGRDLTAAEQEWITRCVAIVKAVQD
jgi:streptomycin 6-kinase